MGVLNAALIANPDSQNGQLLDSVRGTVVAESQVALDEVKVALDEVLDRLNEGTHDGANPSINKPSSSTGGTEAREPMGAHDEEPKEEIRFDIVKLFENQSVASNLRIIKLTYYSKLLERELEKANCTIKSQGHIIDNFEKKQNEETEVREAAEQELEDA